MEGSAGAIKYGCNLFKPESSTFGEYSKLLTSKHESHLKVKRLLVSQISYMY